MDPGSNVDQISQAINLLLSPLGFALVACFLVMATMSMASPTWRWGIFCLTLWASSLGIGITDATESFEMGHLIFPLETFRNNGRTITVGLLVALMVASLTSPRGWRRRLIVGAATAYFIFELMFCLRMAAAGLAARAVGTMPVYIMLFIVASFGVPRWLQSVDNAYSAVRAVAFAGVIFAFTNTFQVVINRSAAGINGRFSGTSGNPQHAATCIAAVMPAVFTLLVRKRESKFIRILLIATVGLLLILLGMTGSRTGVLMLIVSVIVMFRRRFGGLIKLGVVAAVGLLLALAVLPSSQMATDRFTSVQDTRSEVWTTLWQQFLSNPLLGVMQGSVAIRENSYLSTAARMGLVGLIPMTLTLVLAARAIGRARRLRPLLGEHVILSDLAIAGLLSIAVGALTEGFLLATMSVHLMLIYLYLALFGFLSDYAEEVAFAASASNVGPVVNEFAEWEQMALNG